MDGLTIDDAAAIALALPEVTETTRWGRRTWTVGGKGFAWERPPSKADLKRAAAAGQALPEGPILAVMVAGLDAKDVALMAHPGVFFNIEHFKGYPAVLIELSKAPRRLVEEAILDAWLAVAPRTLVELHYPDTGAFHGGM